ncbi:hypothetical protein [Kitasatospora sp. NPDC004531]
MSDEGRPWWLRARVCLALIVGGWASAMFALFLDEEVGRAVGRHLFDPRPPLAACALLLNLVGPAWAVVQLRAVLRRKRQPVGMGHMVLTAVLPVAVLGATAELLFLGTAVLLSGGGGRFQ